MQMRLSEIKNKGTVCCCVLISISYSLFGMLLPANMPFILRSYKEHVLYRFVFCDFFSLMMLESVHLIHGLSHYSFWDRLLEICFGVGWLIVLVEKQQC